MQLILAAFLSVRLLPSPCETGASVLPSCRPYELRNPDDTA